MNDFKQFDAYRREYTRNNSGEEYCDIDHLLRFWRENKAQYLAPLFGDKLILEKEISYDKPQQQLSREMREAIHDYRDFLYSLIDKLASVLGVTDEWNEECRTEEVVWRALRSSILNYDLLVENTLDLGYTDYNDDGPVYVKQYTLNINGKKIQLQRGMKTTRAFTQICKAFGLEEDWEKFRIAHSQVLNTKKLTGTLCLSIHPLDYATASDNDNGWTSCMSWNDYGCYRMGTVEMMNSPMVICAYLKSKKQSMSIDGEEWNSKKWRAWIIVTKDIILCNRHYPYHQADMAISCIEWVKDLVRERYNWEYDDTHTDFYNWMVNTAHYEMEFHTNYMYNDLGGDDMIGCYRKNWKPTNMPGYINFSGPAECMICGEFIKYDVQDAGSLECENCYASYRCERCGEIIDESEDICYGPNGEVFCADCYDDMCVECAVCGETVYKDNAHAVTIPIFKWDEKWTKYFQESETMSLYDFEYLINSKHPMGHIHSRQICNDCLESMNVIHDVTIVSEFDNVRDGVYTIIDPDTISENRMLSILNAPGYEFARWSVAQIKAGRPNRVTGGADALDYYQHILDFWHEQWEKYTEFYKKVEGAEVA